MESFNLKPIGFFHCEEKAPHDLPRQAVSSRGNTGCIELKHLYPLKQALSDIETCSKLWLIYLLHRNKDWRPKVHPPRGADRKIGVFATRAPYRPNPIGLSCVDFVKREGYKIWVKNHDLLDGSPILDVKPYLSFSDSFEDVHPGWMTEENTFEILFSENAEEKIKWLSERLGLNLEVIIKDQVGLNPFGSKRKRIKEIDERLFVFAYKTWRFLFSVEDTSIRIEDVHSGYNADDLEMLNLDPYNDKGIHRLFTKTF